MIGRYVLDWSVLDENSIGEYVAALKDNLADITVPYGAAHCRIDDCHEHRDVINGYYEQVIECIRNASRSTIAKGIRDCSKRITPGWTEYVAESHILLREKKLRRVHLLLVYFNSRGPARRSLSEIEDTDLTQPSAVCCLGDCPGLVGCTAAQRCHAAQSTSALGVRGGSKPADYAWRVSSCRSSILL